MFYRRSLSHMRPSAFIATVALWSLSHACHAGILLTEIHYNGPTAGADPDEFVELSNVGSATVDLGGFRFSDGITFAFPIGTFLDSQTALVIARDIPGFVNAFSAFDGLLFDFSGSLSNSGETLSLLDATNTELWSVPYDDSGSWPRSADGGGDSLQMLPGSSDLSVAESWIGATPTPGTWSGLSSNSTPVPLPGTALLLAAGALGLMGVRRCRS